MKYRGLLILLIILLGVCCLGAGFRDDLIRDGHSHFETGNNIVDFSDTVSGAESTSDFFSYCAPDDSESLHTEELVGEYDQGTPEADTSQWNLLLVNPWHRLPKDYSVKLTRLRNGQSVDERIYPDLQSMIDDARAVGLDPLICSSYRTSERQETLYANKVSEYLAQGYSQAQAHEEAGKWVAYPGTSEHQTGLAVDIVAGGYQLLDELQEQTAEQQWLMDNSWRYGFILRYPNDRSTVTGINYEPWHYRYVGRNVASEMHERGLCLEEYLESIR